MFNCIVNIDIIMIITLIKKNFVIHSLLYNDELLLENINTLIQYLFNGTIYELQQENCILNQNKK